MRILRFAGLLALVSCNLAAAERATNERWALKYAFEENEGSLTLTAFKFPSQQRGIATGVLTRNVHSAIFGSGTKATSVVLLTADGGKSWTTVEIKPFANAIFFLNDSMGWLVADDGIWLTNESGRSWKKISSEKNLNDVFFLSPKHGFAVGNGKRVLETQDGGAEWKPVAAAANPPSSKESTSYNVIAFTPEGRGIVAGQSVPHPGEERSAERRTELGDRQLIYLTTSDNGANWRVAVQPEAGEPDGISVVEGQRGLLVVGLPSSAPWPSEVFWFDPHNAGAERVYRDRDNAITDVLLLPDGKAFIGGYELPGHAHPSPIPGKVKILRSEDSRHWDEIPVDYRAVARNVMFASAGSNTLWAATDTGMIFKLESTQPAAE